MPPHRLGSKPSFSPEQDAVIAAEYAAGASTIALAQQYGRSTSAVTSAICRAGGRMRTLKEATQSESAMAVRHRKRLPDPPPEVQKQILADYAAGRQIRELRVLYNVGWNVIPRILAAHGVTIRRCNCRPLDQTRFPWDTEFFARETPEAAYWAGFLMADGSAQTHGRSTAIRLWIAVKDEAHLRLFCRTIGLSEDAIGRSQPSSFVCRRTGKKHTSSAQVGVQFRHSRLGEQLRRYGIIPNKTYQFLAPDVPIPLLPHFLRGWADGDGYLQIHRCGERLKLVGNSEAMVWYADAMRRIGWTRSVYLYPQQGKCWSELRACSSLFSQTVGALLLAGEEPRLERKWGKAKLSWGEEGCAATTHGMSDSPEYHAWSSMKRKGGIPVCPEWLNDFQAFYDHIGARPSPQHSLGLISRNGNYEPGNVHWTTVLEQMNNRHSNRRLTFRGQTKTLAEWSRETGINSSALERRLNLLGWSVEDTLTRPLRVLKPRSR